MKQDHRAKQTAALLKNQPSSLLKAILSDVFKNYWIVSLLGVMAVMSAMFQAKTTHEARKSIDQSQKLREQRQQYEIDLQALRLELTSLGEANRISSLAKKKLNMIEVTTRNEKVITL